jgi:hypothetical protein
MGTETEAAETALGEQDEVLFDTEDDSPVDADFDTAWKEMAAEEPGKKIAPKAKAKAADVDETAEPPAETTEAGTAEANTENTTPPENETAVQRAERLAREKFGTKPEETKQGDAAAPKKEGAVAAAAVPVKVSFDDVDKDPIGYAKALVSKISDSSRREQLSDVLETTPEIALLASLLARDLAGRASGPATATLPEDVAKRLAAFEESEKRLSTQSTEVQKLREEIAETRYWNALERNVPGAYKTAASKEFTEWLDKEASVGLQTLAGSGDPDDGAAVLNAYNEIQAAKKAKAHDASAKNLRQATNTGLRKIAARQANKANVGNGGAQDEASGWDLKPPKRWQR